jgi:hypothetical protein
MSDEWIESRMQGFVLSSGTAASRRDFVTVTLLAFPADFPFASVNIIRWLLHGCSTTGRGRGRAS